MRNEELGGMWLNRFSNLNTLNNTPLHRGHVTSQPQSSSSVFSMIHDDCVDVDVTLSNDFARMSVFNKLGNVGVKARGNGYGYGANVMDSSYPHAFSHSLCSFDAHVHEETGTPLPIWGVSVSSDLKGHTFGPPMEFSSHTQRSNPCYGQVPLQNPFHATRPFAMDCDVKSPFLMQQQPKVAMNVNTPSSHYFPAAKERGTTRVAVNPNGGDFSHSREDPLGFQCDGGFILQEKDVKCCNGCRGCNSLWGCNESLSLPVQEVGVGEELPQHIPSRVAPTKHEKNGVLTSDVSPSSQPLLYNFSPLAKFQGYIYYLAKDQNGCRFLQRMIDEGTSEDVLVLFNGVIDDVVELMIDPFGNYLVQKLLDVCGEDERLQVVSMLTEEPGQLVKTSLNLHGTRVVQKLITTVDSRKQIAMLRSAIQSGFLALIKDLNGNHVIQRCLQYFSCKDNEFIFYAATKFCVEIATHQHGCCVLQRCIDYSTGKYKDMLVKEICRHGHLLAQDPFGNYVVQYIIEMENPSASLKLHSQFKGNYANLSMQKFSSHVVEKCLVHIVEIRSRIVQELSSFPHLERLLQDPYANYVVQRALGVTKGSLHASLAEAVRPYKTLRSSPYCKRIFSRNLLNK
ncbi:putative pumilio 7, chloroplastic [Glycine soja]|uniref:Putative pumilio-like 7, chloroplastic n=1 Tax=Glycine soja TaxID=3848 RepID=A0A0B2SIF7_GLYSO|nr:putative pumilio homolog 8, chloroplastic [Glycine soja]KHN44785.1 Putative pumilio like 7, chloroplastic [Glycine soja]RZB71541.1 putative pumilio-like 7, chloroplastic [Glycine soja]